MSISTPLIEPEDRQPDEQLTFESDQKLHAIYVLIANMLATAHQVTL